MKKRYFVNFKKFSKFFRVHWTPILTIVLTTVLVLSTIESCRTNIKNLELAKHIETRSLCEAFSVWFWESNYKANIMEKRRADIELGYLHQWLDLEDFVPNEIDTIWKTLEGDTTIWYNEKKDSVIVNKRALFFSKNYAFVKLFNIFEDAMMLSKSDLLDVPFFKNYFTSTIKRLEKAKDPSTQDIIEYLKERYESDNVFAGYKYCRDSIFVWQSKLNP